MTRTDKLAPGVATRARRLAAETDDRPTSGLEGGHTSADIPRLIHDLRTEAGLTQKELAVLVGTTASVICRLEDAEYEGHSVAMLRRIAAALDRRVEVRFVPSVGDTEGSCIKS